MNAFEKEKPSVHVKSIRIKDNEKKVFRMGIGIFTVFVVPESSCAWIPIAANTDTLESVLISLTW